MEYSRTAGNSLAHSAGRASKKRPAKEVFAELPARAISPGSRVGGRRNVRAFPYPQRAARWEAEIPAVTRASPSGLIGLGPNRRRCR